MFSQSPTLILEGSCPDAGKHQDFHFALSSSMHTQPMVSTPDWHGLQQLWDFVVYHGQQHSRTSAANVPFASLALQTAVRLQQSNHRESASTACRTFKAMDRDAKGWVTENDLQRYAKEHGLPAGYAALFMQVAQQSAAQRSKRQHTDSTGAAQLAYADFAHFVESREKGLRAAFDKLNVDGSGKLTRDSLLQALSSVTIECNKSGNTYRCQDKCVNRLLTSMAGQKVLGNSTTVSYDQFQRFFMLLPQNELMVDYWLSAACPARCDVGGCVVLREDEKGQATAAGHLLAGALAGAVSRTATAPLETIRLQSMTGALAVATQPNQPLGMASAAHQIMAQGGGWKALFRGNGVNVLKSAPQKALDFFAFEAFKNAPWITRWAGQGTSLSTLLAAGMAGATSMTMLYPLEWVHINKACAAQYMRMLPVATGSITAGETVQLGEIRRDSGLLPSLVNPLSIVSAYILSAQSGVPDAQPNCKCMQFVDMQHVAAVMRLFGCPASYDHLTVTAALQFSIQVVRSRITCDPTFAQRSLAGSVQFIVRTEGPRALYRGLLPSVTAIIPEAAICYGCFDLLKASYATVTRQQEAGVVASLACGVLASCLGQFVSYPLETVSRRMQVATAAQSLHPLQVAQDMVKKEGHRALYKGLGAASARTIPMAVLSFGTYELVRRWLVHIERSRNPLPLPARSQNSAKCTQRSRQAQVAGIRQSLLRHTRTVKST